ncbi:FMN-binding negative transcriptional regulator [Shewanella sp. 3B26]|uniref:FMN-binding negative transcriptional regulator n=1 Tax=Shewanella zhuhaiensis TaxID=2919576 RepID=A0AAJ1BL17_9GAMM|nr:FMN-binding negative transcriptional regulator [Shewanella zhuhaiensis]MCH4296667.1 FMN-binding negative transcriptional regulator [Shewanella zhuhaiensis]
MSGLLIAQGPLACYFVNAGLRNLYLWPLAKPFSRELFVYIPPKLQLDQAQACELIKREPFALLISAEGGIEASHLPLILSDCGTRLYGHMARANPQWQELDGKSVLAIFSGPHAYISPNWYAKGPAVPTWNYTAVQVKGRVTLLEGAQAMDTLMETVNRFEPGLLSGVLMPADYVARLSAAIVAFEIQIEKIEGKAKLGQQRKSDDQQGVTAGLEASTHREAGALLAEMYRLNLGLGLEDKASE